MPPGEAAAIEGMEGGRRRLGLQCEEADKGCGGGKNRGARVLRHGRSLSDTARTTLLRAAWPAGRFLLCIQSSGPGRRLNLFFIWTPELLTPIVSRYIVSKCRKVLRQGL